RRGARRSSLDLPFRVRVREERAWRRLGRRALRFRRLARGRGGAVVLLGRRPGHLRRVTAGLSPDRLPPLGVLLQPAPRGVPDARLEETRMGVDAELPPVRAAWVEPAPDRPRRRARDAPGDDGEPLDRLSEPRDRTEQPLGVRVPGIAEER